MTSKSRTRFQNAAALDSSEVKSDSEGVLDGAGNVVSQRPHFLFRLGFDHDAGKGFSSGIADHDAAVAVDPLDPLTFGSVAVVIVLTAMAASAAPAWRASRINPVVAFRHDG